MNGSSSLRAMSRRIGWIGGGVGFEPSVDYEGIGCGVLLNKIIATEKMSWGFEIKDYIS